ncbi:hypothetical protein Ddye_011575 [Dipteronia dyeriana]|uniref:Reverse transcriptase domain-containing protein n=1 Tax=Dipteronia dyeriana TaxID=168575 RepID=A0AAD9X2T7_9ROSI|nr:hypothetical protein Ddye_011575 [Dipteronia dyeriana]
MQDFKPISLVGSMYKILVKVLASHTENVINTIIGDSQIAFVKNHQILDNFVIAKEIINMWKNDNLGGLLVKLDFEKAYYCVDNGVLDSIMREMGFGEKWRRWMSSYITTLMLSVLVNGSPTSQFGMETELHQGDPLSPFIFNFVTEVRGFKQLVHESLPLRLDDQC